MFPEVKVHVPRGVLPKLAVRQRTVLDYQPSWLLLAVPAVLVLRSRMSKTRAQAGTTATSSRGQSGGATAAGRRGRAATTARAIMTGGVECVREHETVLDAATRWTSSVSARCRSAAATSG